jgi:Tfp pilus assembly protein PilP
MPGEPGAAAPAAAPAVSKEALLPFRKDPFKPFAVRKPDRTQVLISMLPSISHVRIAPAPVKRLGAVEVVNETLPPQPVRRMAGVLMNSKISAILETDGSSDIVTPGMVVNRSGSRVRVESITPDQIVLKTLDTKKPFTVRVNLQGSIVSSDSDESAGDGAIAPIM